METILIQAANPEERRLIEEFLKQHNIIGRVLTEDDKEDLVLSRMMEDTDYNNTVPTDDFLKKPRS